MLSEGILDNQVVFVTGGSGGIGAAICKHLVSLGAQVYFSYHQSEKKAQQLDKELASLGNKGKAYAMDVCDSLACKTVMENIVDLSGQINILINNSGITKDSLLVGMSDDDLMDVLNTNVAGYFNAARAAVPYMCMQKKGVIINVSSVSSVRSNRGQSNYAASKGAVNAMTQALAVELAPRNIRVNAIAPGMIETNMGAELREKVSDQILSGILCKRFGKPEEIAYAVSFLVSPYADYINGEVLFVDGGMKIA